jgi:hypothetical protein
MSSAQAMHSLAYLFAGHATSHLRLFEVKVRGRDKGVEQRNGMHGEARREREGREVKGNERKVRAKGREVRKARGERSGERSTSTLAPNPRPFVTTHTCGSVLTSTTQFTYTPK